MPPYAVVVGVPAKIIKYRFDDEKLATLEQMQWWNMSDDELRQKRDFFKIKNNRREVYERESYCNYPGKGMSNRLRGQNTLEFGESNLLVTNPSAEAGGCDH